MSKTAFWNGGSQKRPQKKHVYIIMLSFSNFYEIKNVTDNFLTLKKRFYNKTHDTTLFVRYSIWVRYDCIIICRFVFPRTIYVAKHIYFYVWPKISGQTIFYTINGVNGARKDEPTKYYAVISFSNWVPKKNVI